jgi:carboxypeptidase family protein
MGWRVLRNRYVLVLGPLALATVAWNLYVAAHAHGVLDGRVIGPDGRPVPDATVTLFERTLTTLEPRSTTRTGPDGRFRFTGHRAHHLVLEAAKDGVGHSPRVSLRLYFRGQDFSAVEPLRLR